MLCARVGVAFDACGDACSDGLLMGSVERVPNDLPQDVRRGSNDSDSRAMFDIFKFCLKIIKTRIIEFAFTCIRFAQHYRALTSYFKTTNHQIHIFNV